MANRPPSKTAKLLKSAPAISAENVVWALIEAPEKLNHAEKRRDLVRAQFDAYAAGLAIDAMTALLFPGKDGEKRAASNETERKLAIDKLTVDEPDFVDLKEEMDAAQRDVNLCRDRLEALKLAARLLIAQAQ